MQGNKNPDMLMEKQQMNSQRKHYTVRSQIPKDVRQDKIRSPWFVICSMTSRFLDSVDQIVPQEVHAWLEMKAGYEPKFLNQELVLFQKTLRLSTERSPGKKKIS